MDNLYEAADSGDVLAHPCIIISDPVGVDSCAARLVWMLFAPVTSSTIFVNKRKKTKRVMLYLNTKSL